MLSVLTEFNPTLNTDNSYIVLNDQLNPGGFGTSIGSLSTWDRKGLYIDKLAAKWIVNLDTDKTTIDFTTNLVKTSTDNTSLYQQLNTNDCILRYNRVTSDVFIDTLFSNNASKSER